MILKQPDNKYLNVIMVLLGIVISFVLIFAVEGFLRIIKINETINEAEYPAMYYEKYDFGVKKAKTGTHRSFSKIQKTGKMIYDVEYSVDEYGRRITPVK